MDRSDVDAQGQHAEELATYFAKFSAAMTRMEEELARWKVYEEDYKALKTTLLDLPKETSHSVMVPIGNLAFMPGKLIHTNEILVMLGDNWFVDRSAVQAAEIVDRRMEFVQENITKLKAQEEQIRTKSGLAPGLLGGQEYNEEGLPIVEITEPYFSDEEEEKEAQKAKGKSILPNSQKTPEEQARDRAILDRLEELEREEEERERRREAGEIVTSDEETESDDEPADYDDEESEDEFRPRGLDSDEEYEEEVRDHSADEDEDDLGLQEDTELSGRKSVRFADQVAKPTKGKAKSSSSTPTTLPAAKPKSPADLFNQMKARQQAVRSSASEQIVTMETLESTLANMTTQDASLESAEQEETEAKADAPLKSILKPASKKVSLFKQMRTRTDSLDLAKDKLGPILAHVSAGSKPVQDAPVTATKPVQDAPATAPKKMSRFAKDRAAASASNAETGLLSQGITVKEVSAATVPSSSGKRTTAAGVYEVVEREVVTASAPSQKLSGVVERNMNEQSTPASSSVGTRDVIENTFTKPALASSEVEASSTGRRKKPSLFRQQQQQRQVMEPEPAVPESSFQLSAEDDEYGSSKSVPKVGSSRDIPVVVEKAPSAVGKGSSVDGNKSNSSTLRTIPVVASSKLKDTPLMKGVVVEHEETVPVDEDELEDDMLMRQVVSEYQERRQALIAKHGAFNQDGIERLWEQQVVIPPGMIVPGPEAELEEDEDEGGDEEDPDEDIDEDEGHAQDHTAPPDDKNEPPKKLSLFRASRLAGRLAHQ
ncbi:uri1, prefoldin-like chaperone [Mortierella sp. NVP85]|nr:uri1, prefoldin-like chaperone [Mortierella sp. NVP85]